MTYGADNLTSSKWGKFWLWSLIWSWRSRSITCKNNRDLNQDLLHLWSKFGDPTLNGSRVIAQTSKWLTHRPTHTHMDTHTDAGDDDTRRPKRASGKKKLHITPATARIKIAIFIGHYLYLHGPLKFKITNTFEYINVQFTNYHVWLYSKRSDLIGTITEFRASVNWMFEVHSPNTNKLYAFLNLLYGYRYLGQNMVFEKHGSVFGSLYMC